MEHARFGRQAELARVSSFLDAVPSGPEALILGGEPGIGKSALWLDTLAQARGRSYRTLSSRPTESEAKLSFAALGDLLEGVVDEALDGLPPPQRSALEVALLLAEAGGSPPDRRTLSSGFHGALSALAAAGPLLLAIDDAQWLDLPSARVLEFAIRRLHDVPIGIVITARFDGSGPLPLGLERAFPDERIDRLVVGPVTEHAIGDLLNAELSTRLPRSILLQIHGTAAGNPFLALELGRAILRLGDRPRARELASSAVDARRPGRRPLVRAHGSRQAGPPDHGGRIPAHHFADRRGDGGCGCRTQHRSGVRRRRDRGERGAHPIDTPVARDRSILGVVHEGAEVGPRSARGGGRRPGRAGAASRARRGTARRGCRCGARSGVTTGERSWRPGCRGAARRPRSRA